MTIVAFGLGLPAAGQALPETTVKAAFVAKLPTFARWPAATEPSRTSAVTLCLSPAQPFRGLVDDFARQTRIGDRPLQVRQLRSGEDPGGCNALFVAPTDAGLLRHVDNRPVLTIGDDPGFCERGGMVNLHVVGGRVRFEINLAAARRSGLEIDAQVLALASRVYGGQR